MTLAIKINGQPYVNFNAATVYLTVTAVARAFSFTSTADSENSFPVKIGDEVFITADGIDVLEGFVELLEVNYDAFSHSIRVGGRSRLADLVDSTVPKQFEIDGTSLQSIAANVMSSIELEPLVDNQAGSIRNFEGDITSAEVGQNAMEFLERYSRKRQVLLTSDGKRTLVLARAGTSRAPAALKNVVGANDNNVLRSTLSLDYSDIFYHYLVHAQLNTSVLDFLRDPKDVSDQPGEIFDNDIRKTRKLEMNAEESMDSFSSRDRAAWERNIRLGHAYIYSAVVVGNSHNGILWLPNTKIKILDEFANVDDELLIRDVRYNFDLNGGSTTELTMIKAKAFTLEIEQSQREANSQTTSETFIKA